GQSVVVMDGCLGGLYLDPASLVSTRSGGSDDRDLLAASAPGAPFRLGVASPRALGSWRRYSVDRPLLAALLAPPDEVDDTEFLKRKLKYDARQLLTSGGKEYVPDGIAGHHSPFAARFLDALATRGGPDGIL